MRFIIDLGTGSYEYSNGTNKILYDIDDGTKYPIVRDILLATGQKKAIVITSIVRGDIIYNSDDDIRNLFKNFLYLSIDIPIVLGTVINEKHLTLVNKSTLHLYKILGFIDIGKIIKSFNENYMFISAGSAYDVISFYKTKDYLKEMRNDLIPFCRNHVADLIKSNPTITDDPNILVDTLNYLLETVIRGFNQSVTGIPTTEDCKKDILNLSEKIKDLSIGYSTLALSETFARLFATRISNMNEQTLTHPILKLDVPPKFKED